MTKNDKKENKDRLDHQHVIGYLVHILNGKDKMSKERNLQKPTEELHAIIHVDPNAEVTSKRNDYIE